MHALVSAVIKYVDNEKINVSYEQYEKILL